MKAYKLALPLLAATTLLCTGVGVANAQEDPADCGAATIALNQADQAHRDAVAADQKLAAAEDADQALKDAKQRLKDAEKKRDDAAAAATSRQTELDRLKADGDPDTDGVQPVGTPEQIAAAQRLLNQAEKELRDREKTVRDRIDERDDAKDAADAKTAKLREKANATDADELKKRLDETKADFDRLCGGVTTTPAPDSDVDCDEVSDDEAQRILNGDRSDPNNLDTDGDGLACEVDEVLADDDNDVVVNNNVAVPSGGISTGVGPRDS